MPIPITTRRAVSEAVKDYRYGFRTETSSVYTAPKGLSRELVVEISERKNEPKWMRDFRLTAYDIFCKKKMPNFGPDLSTLDLENIHYYVQPQDKPKNNWEEVPSEIKDTFEKLGIPESERKFLAGTGAQFESEVVYHRLKKHLEEKGVIFDSTDEALRKYPHFFKEYFGKIVPAADNAFAALNSAVWSGGSFIYIPKGVKVDLPLQAYFRINAENMGQFERTLIIADEESFVHYVEGCTAPIYSTDSLHSAVVEIVVKKNARVQYTTVQNWSRNVYNLVTKRAYAYENAEMFWLDCNLGSKVTMKYPSVVLMESGAKGQVYSLAFAGSGQIQDAGGKMIHLASNTSSTIISKSISKNGGRASYRGLLKIAPNAHGVKSHVTCDALLLDEKSRSDTYPTMKIEAADALIAHEATVSKMGEEQLFYLMSRGFSEEEAAGLIINGFANEIIKKLPMEFAVELNRLMELEMKGSVG
ncbi:Fe-S cluster assembly protein SufB [Candidatus Peregrinibacteria bacterium]|nr:Fe-S cluster assembly protein SufB [Candidatus Peregrinibacteria bacterium]